LFRVTLRRHDLAAEVWHLKEPQKLPPVLMVRNPEPLECCPRLALGRDVLALVSQTGH